jgi:glycosyltransferase involved in cell wall biosynthesis
MRILVAHSFYRIRGGEDSFVERQVDLLRTAGHEVKLEARFNAALPDAITTAMQMTLGTREHRRIDRAIERLQPDVIHLHNPYPAFGPSIHLAARRARVPLVQTVHNARLRCPNGLMFTEGAQCRRCEGGAYQNAVLHRCFPSRAQAATYASALWTHRFALRTDDRVDTFIAPSKFVQGRLADWGISDDRVALVRHFTVGPEAPPEVGLTGLYVGRLSAEKGVDVLLGALAALDDPPFEIVGDGPEEATLAAQAATLGLVRTRFLGRLGRDGVVSALERARYVVMPSRSEETAGLAGLEGMAWGRPLVATALGALPELVAHGRGRSSPAGAVAALAEAMATYVADPVLASADGLRGWSFVRDECSPGRHVASLMDAYARAMTIVKGSRE